MMTQRMTMRRRIVASIASAALAMSMVVVAPMSALAADNTVNDLVAPGSTLNVVNGQVSLCSSDYLGDSYPVKVQRMDEEAYHLDFKIDSSATNTCGASVNKHSGVLTTTSEGTATVIVNLVSGAKPSQNSGNPCTGFTVLDTETFMVSATVSSAYTYQGVNNAIKMTDPSVGTFSGNNTDGWTNQLGAISAASDGWYYFTVQMTSGFKNNNTADLFAGINDGNVKVKDSNNSVLATLDALNSGDVRVASVDNDTKTVVIKVASSIVSSGGNKLVFETGFRGNNVSNTLGTTVTFVIQQS